MCKYGSLCERNYCMYKHEVEEIVNDEHEVEEIVDDKNEVENDTSE